MTFMKYQFKFFTPYILRFFRIKANIKFLYALKLLDSVFIILRLLLVKISLCKIRIGLDKYTFTLLLIINDNIGTFI